MKTVDNLGVTLSSPLSLPQTRWRTAVMAAVVTRSVLPGSELISTNKQTNRVYVILLLQS